MSINLQTLIPRTGNLNSGQWGTAYGKLAVRIVNTSNTDNYEMCLKAGWDRNKSRNSTTVYRCSYVGMSVTRSPTIINTEVGSVSII